MHIVPSLHSYWYTHICTCVCLRIFELNFMLVHSHTLGWTYLYVFGSLHTGAHTHAYVSVICICTHTGTYLPSYTRTETHTSIQHRTSHMDRKSRGKQTDTPTLTPILIPTLTQEMEGILGIGTDSGGFVQLHEWCEEKMHNVRGM